MASTFPAFKSITFFVEVFKTETVCISERSKTRHVKQALFCFCAKKYKNTMFNNIYDNFC